MNLPAGAFLDYVIAKEAYYAHVTGPDPEIQIRASSREGGAHWEFAAVQVGNIGVQLRLFDAAWRAFNDIPEFFQTLAAAGRGTTLADVRKILDDLGAVDATQRVDPNRQLTTAASFGNVDIRLDDN